jgi:hypothetical protein
VKLSYFLSVLIISFIAVVSIAQSPPGGYSSPSTGGSSANAVLNNQANTYSTGLQDFTAGTMKLPGAAGFVSSANSQIGKDTTTSLTHLFVGSDNTILSGASTFSSNQIPKNNAATNSVMIPSLLTDNGTTVTYTGAGGVNAPGLISAGTAATLTGTGACATITTQTGGATVGRATCTGATAASTFTINTGITAANGWVCNVQDQTTAQTSRQTSTATNSCTFTFTSVTANDVLVFTATGF